MFDSDHLEPRWLQSGCYLFAKLRGLESAQVHFTTLPESKCGTLLNKTDAHTFSHLLELIYVQNNLRSFWGQPRLIMGSYGLFLANDETLTSVERRSRHSQGRREQGKMV